jgi:hypothetical protein
MATAQTVVEQQNGALVCGKALAWLPANIVALTAALVHRWPIHVTC